MIVVVGGGLAGLRAALTVQASGQQVHLIEAQSEVGGRLSSSVIDGFTIDRGFQVVNPGYSELQSLDIRTLFHPIPAGAVARLGGGQATFFGDPRREARSIPFFIPAVLPFFNQFFALLRSINFAKTEESESAATYLQRVGVTGEVYENLIEPFLRGVFLTALTEVDARFARRVLRSLYRQVPGLPDGGVQALANELRNRVKSLQSGESVFRISRSGRGFTVETEHSTLSARKVIVATDYQSAKNFSPDLPVIQWARSTAWYFSIENPMPRQHQLHVAPLQSGPIVTAIDVAAVVPSYSPDGRGLMSVTTLEPSNEVDVRKHLESLYGERLEGELISTFQIENALPILAPGSRKSGIIDEDGLIFAGDYLTEPSQNGALMSGRLAGERAINN